MLLEEFVLRQLGCNDLFIVILCSHILSGIFELYKYTLSLNISAIFYLLQLATIIIFDFQNKYFWLQSLMFMISMKFIYNYTFQEIVLLYLRYFSSLRSDFYLAYPDYVKINFFMLFTKIILLNHLNDPYCSSIAVFQKEECSICLTEGNLVSLRKCQHRFHRLCVESWVKKIHHCPLCRSDLKKINGSDAFDLRIVYC